MKWPFSCCLNNCAPQSASNINCTINTLNPSTPYSGNTEHCSFLKEVSYSSKGHFEPKFCFLILHTFEHVVCVLGGSSIPPRTEATCLIYPPYFMAPAEEATQTLTPDALAPQEPAESDGSAPPEKDWKEEYARLRKDYDAKAARLKEVDKSKEKEDKVPEDETLWYVENAGELKLVKSEYDKHLSELTSLGAKPTLATRQKALALAKAERGVTVSPEVQRQGSSASAVSVTNRTLDVNEDVSLTETDLRLGVKPETKKKWQHLVEGQG